MRIAVAAHTRGRVGGVETYLATVIPALARAGHDVSCWFETDGAASEPILRADEGVTSWTADAGEATALNGLRAWRPDLVFAHGVADVAHERALLDVAPAVLFAHSYYGTCISGSKLRQWPATQTCTRRFGPACLLQYHARRCGGWSPVSMTRQYRLQQSRFDLLGAYARVVVASRHMAGEYARHGLDAHVRVVPYPVETPAAPAAAPAPHDGWQLLYLGRLEPSKGAHVALDSAAQVAAAVSRPVRLQLSGEGSMRADLEARASAAMSSCRNLQVVFTGWLDERLTISALDATDLLLVPSCWPEPFGLVGVEAGLRGVPAVAFAVGGIPEWLTDGVTGRLVPADPPDASRFAEAITACLTDEQQLRRMGERARDAAGRFRLTAHLTGLEAVFAEVCGAGRREVHA